MAKSDLTETVANAYPMPEPVPTWARAAPNKWTPANRRSARRFFESVGGEKALGISLDSYGWIVAGYDDKSSKSQSRTKSSKPAQPAVVKAEAKVNDNLEAKRNRKNEAKRLWREKQKAQKSMNDLDCADLPKVEAAPNLVPNAIVDPQVEKSPVDEASAEAVAAPTSAEVTPVVEDSESPAGSPIMSPGTEDDVTAETALSMTEGGKTLQTKSQPKVPVTIDIDHEAYELVRCLVLCKQFDVSGVSAGTVIADFVHRHVTDLREEIREQLLVQTQKFSR